VETLWNLPALASLRIMSARSKSETEKSHSVGGVMAQPPCGSAMLETVSSIVPPKQAVVGGDGMCR